MVGDCVSGKAILNVKRRVQVRCESVPEIRREAEMGVVFLQQFMLSKAII